LPRYNEYIGRLQRVLQQGWPVVDIAVLYPIHGLQAAYYFGPGQPYTGGVIPAWADYMDVGERLSLELRHDFTYLHPETLDSRCCVANGLLELQQPECPQQYRLIILPGMEAISASNLARVKDFFDQGGQVIATTRLPDHSAEFGRDDEVRAMVRHIFGTQAIANGTDRAALPSRTGQVLAHRNDKGGAAWFIEHPTPAALRQAIDEALPQPDVAWADPPVVHGGNLSYLHKEIGGRHFWFFANSSDTPVATPVCLRGAYSLQRWDPHTGRIEPCPATTSPAGAAFQLQLQPVSSVFVVGGDDDTT
jgi:hypothetical protein